MPDPTCSKASIVPYRSYKTLDGDILFGGGNDKLFGVLCDGLGFPEWKTDPRFTVNSERVKHREHIDTLIENVTKTKTTKNWLDIFEGSGMPYAAINDIQETLHHPQGELLAPSRMPFFSMGKPALMIFIVIARGMVEEVDHPACGPIKLVNTPIRYSGAKPGIRMPPPTLGQHSDMILGEIGLGEKEIHRLKKEGIVS